MNPLVLGDLGQLPEQAGLFPGARSRDFWLPTWPTVGLAHEARDQIGLVRADLDGRRVCPSPRRSCSPLRRRPGVAWRRGNAADSAPVWAGPATRRRMEGVLPVQVADPAAPDGVGQPRGCSRCSARVPRERSVESVEVGIASKVDFRSIPSSARKAPGRAALPGRLRAYGRRRPQPWRPSPLDHRRCLGTQWSLPAAEAAAIRPTGRDTSLGATAAWATASTARRSARADTPATR